MTLPFISVDEPPGVSDAASLDERFASVEPPPVFGTDIDSLNTLGARYPQNLIFDLTEAMEHVQLYTPPGVITDFVEIAEKACRIYGEFSEFFSITDELFCGHDYDTFVQNNVSPEQAQNAEVQYYMAEMYSNYTQAVEAYCLYVMGLLNYHSIPTFEESGCVYMPDGFIVGTNSLVFKLALEDR